MIASEQRRIKRKDSSICFFRTDAEFIVFGEVFAKVRIFDDQQIAVLNESSNKENGSFIYQIKYLVYFLYLEILLVNAFLTFDKQRFDLFWN